MQSVFGALPGKEALLAALDGPAIATFCTIGLLLAATEVFSHLRRIHACRRLERRLASDPFMPAEERISLRLDVENAPEPLDLPRLVARSIGCGLLMAVPIFAKDLAADGWYAAALLVSAAYFALIYVWHRFNDPPKLREAQRFAITVPREAKFGFLCAAAVTTIMFALFLTEII